jgi:hypothetical protein
MIIASLLSLLGGGAFRAVAERFLGYFEKKQEFEQQILLAKLQHDLAKEERESRLELAKMQGDIDLRKIAADMAGKIEQASIEMESRTVEAIGALQRAEAAPTGIKFIDFINRFQRPYLTITATTMFFLLTGFAFAGKAPEGVSAMLLIEAFMGVASSVFGYLLMDRSLLKSKK